MTAQEFIKCMPADALAQTIIHIYETCEPGDAPEAVIDICWHQLVALVGVDEATEMVSYQDLSEVAS